MAHISIIEPLSKAFSTTKQILFTPFNLVKWLGLGFTAWLALLTEGLTLNFNPPSSGMFDSPAADRILPWMQQHPALVISVGIAVIVIILAISLVMSWLNCRGKFMFLDNVLNNRAEIQAPWRQFRRQGNSLFLFSICFMIGTLAVLATLALLLFMIAWPDIVRHNFGINGLSAILLAVIFLISFFLTMAGLLAFLNDFVVPLMLLKRQGVMAAWGEFLELFKAQVGTFALYLLFRLALTLAISYVVLMACCLLCCTVLIPYVGTVILLPVHVFWRSYSVHFLEQFGAGYRLFSSNRIEKTF